MAFGNNDVCRGPVNVAVIWLVPMSSKIQCKAKTLKGSRCKRRALAGTPFCKSHTKTENKLSLLRSEYESRFPVASRFAEACVKQLITLIEETSIALGVPIESRLKTWNSIAEKIERKQMELVAIQDLDDFVGLRLILLFQRDLEEIHSLLNQNFNIIRFENTFGRLEETQFGYQSVHYIVTMPEQWLGVPTMSDFQGYRAEIQVRTLAQHIWAAASHKLQYKQEKNVPPPLRRSIHRVSAILETVDLEFERLLNLSLIHI